MYIHIYGERNKDRTLLRRGVPSLLFLSLPLSPLSFSLSRTAREIILDTFYFDRKRFARRLLLIAESSGFVRSQASSNRETPRKISCR